MVECAGINTGSGDTSSGGEGSAERGRQAVIAVSLPDREMVVIQGPGHRHAAERGEGSIKKRLFHW